MIGRDYAERLAARRRRRFFSNVRAAIGYVLVAAMVLISGGHSMATLVEVRNSEGVVGRCDAKCYTASGGSCDCICGGRNHGCGERQAVENTREHVEEMLEAHYGGNWRDALGYVIPDAVAQRELEL